MSVEDPFTGRWEADTKRSNLDPNHRFRSARLSITRNGDRYVLDGEGIGPDGEHCTESQSIEVDGLERAASGNLITVATRPAAGAIHVDARQGDYIVGQANYAVSADGCTLTASTWGIDVQGRSFSTVIVFTRES